MPTDLSAAALPRWTRIAMVAGAVILAAGLCLYAYRSATRPVTLTIAAGSLDAEAAQLVSAIASRLASTNSQIRLKVVERANTLEAARALSDPKIDLAIVRSDSGNLSDARTVVKLTHVVVMIIVPPGSSIDSLAKLNGKTIGIVGGEVNRVVVSALAKEQDLAQAKIRLKDLALTDVAAAVQTKQVDALLVVSPISDSYLSLIRGFFPRQSKKEPAIIPIESAEAIEAVARSYKSYELPKGTLRGSPPVPDEDVTTLRASVYLVADKKLDNDRVTALTKAIMDVRRDLIAAHPLLAQIAAPDTDKDALIPIHPGAAAYFSGEEKTLFDKYGDQLFYASMLLGMLTSVLAGAWKFMGATPQAISPIHILYALADRARGAKSDSELALVEDEIDAILEAELARDGGQGADAAALGLAAHRLEYLIDRRRAVLRNSPAESPAA